MEKDLNRDIGKMQNGIKGFYRSSRFKTRVGAIVLFTILLIGLACGLLFLRDRTWSGRVYVFAHSNSVYSTYFYKNSSMDAILKDRDLSISEFENLTNLTVIQRKTVSDAEIEAHGLTGIVPDAQTMHSMSVSAFIIVLTDNSGNVIFYGNDAFSVVIKKFANALLESGF